MVDTTLHIRALGERIERFRLLNDLSQSALSASAGIGERTLRRLESGEGGTIDTLVRVLVVLQLDTNLQALIPDHAVRPIERIRPSKSERQRASGKRKNHAAAGNKLRESEQPWQWGDKAGSNKSDKKS